MPGNSVNLGSAHGTITISTDAMQRSLQAAQKRMAQFQQMAGRLASMAKTALKAGVVALAAAFGTLALALRDSTALYREQRDAVKQQIAVLTSTGNAIGMTTQALQAHAAALQKVTNFGDEATIGAQNLLLTFTNIGSETFPRATEAVLDMSVAFKQDLKAASIQLGKALNDPIRGVSALSEVGVSFTDTQREMIRAMVEAGDTAGAQAVILSELEKQVGGSARAMADPVIQMKNAWGDVKEAVGGVLAAIQNDFARGMTSALPAIQGLLVGMAATLRSLLSIAGEVLRGLASQMGIDFGEIAEDGETWGANIALSVARGIAAALTAIVSVIAEIGRILAYWLAPGSPPRVAPDIDKWGEAAIQEYIDGWGRGDWSALDGIGSVIEDALRALAPDDLHIGETIAEARRLSAELITVARNGGDTAAAMQRLEDATGPLPQTVRDVVDAELRLVRASQDLENAQQRVNDITADYDRILRPLQDNLRRLQGQYDDMARARDAAMAPLDAEMRAINDRQQAIRDQQRLEELQATAADESLDARDRELARLEMQEIVLRQQITAEERKHDVAMAAIDEQIDAAQRQISQAEERRAAELEAAQTVLQAAQSAQTAAQNELENRRASVTEAQRVRDLMAEAEEKSRAIGPGIADGAEGAAGTVADAISDFEDEIADLMADIDDAMAPLRDTLNEAGEHWGTVFRQMGKRARDTWHGIQTARKTFQTLFSGGWVTFTDGMGERWDRALTSMTERLRDMWTNTEPKLAAWSTSVTTWFGAQDWAALGYNVMESIIDGLASVDANSAIWLDVGGSLLRGLDASLRSIRRAFREAIIDFYIGAINAAWDAAADWFNGMFNSGGGGRSGAGSAPPSGNGGNSRNNGANSVGSMAAMNAIGRQMAGMNALASAQVGPMTQAPSVVVEAMHVTIGTREIDQRGAARAIEVGLRQAASDIWRENRARGLP